MRPFTTILTSIALAGVSAASPAPALQPVSVFELTGPLAVELQEPPVYLGGVEDFRRLYRDPRFPSVLMRRHGGLYAAFRQTRPIPSGRALTQTPSDMVYFIGRPSVEQIARTWPDAVVEEAPAAERTIAEQPRPIVRTARPDAEATPRMAHIATRARRLEALAEKYAPER